MRQLRRVTLVRSPRAGYRLNLVVPTVDAAATFGGIRTALDCFEAVGADVEQRRIIAVGRNSPTAAEAVPDYEVVEPGDDPSKARQFTALRKPWAELAIRPEDVFVSTFWTTAELVLRIRRWQASIYGQAPAHWAYVIQDYEPGFYPFSAQWLLAQATYGHPQETVAIFNTSMLRDYFHASGIHFEREFAFEPRLLPELRASIATSAGPRSRSIVVYGRPGTARNGFPAIVDGLRAWRASDPEAAGWRVVSAGRAHADIDLGGGVTLKSIGKLDLADYAALLKEAAIGISLMVSPHPSYPPLEMAYLGMLVLTNRFGVKDLSTWHPNIRTTDDVSAESLAAGIAALCRRFEEDPHVGERALPLRLDFVSDDEPFTFADEVASLLRQGLS